MGTERERTGGDGNGKQNEMLPLSETMARSGVQGWIGYIGYGKRRLDLFGGILRDVSLVQGIYGGNIRLVEKVRRVKWKRNMDGTRGTFATGTGVRE